MYMKRFFAAVTAMSAAGILVAGCGPAPKTEPSKPEANKPVAAKPADNNSHAGKDYKVVAEIGSEKITLDDIDAMIKQIPEQYQPMAEAHKDMFLDSVVSQKLLYSEASKLNLDKDPDVQKQIEDARKDIIIKEYLRKEIEDKVTVSDEDAKKYYEENLDKFKEPEKVEVSHILVDTEAGANDILAKLKAGDDFAKLAKEKSKCPSKDKGGELGYISKGQTVPEFETVAFSLQPGQLSGVIKSQFGYHVIKVTAKQPEKTIPFDEIKDQLKQMLLADKHKERFDTILRDLKEKNKVVIYKDVLMPPAPKTEPAKPVMEPAVNAPEAAPAN
jgi:peptidyl-prolyl cis-trans isomerase C